METPALIPSFSSKGFRIKDGVSDLAGVLEVTAPLIHDAYLISAYDIHHGLLPNLKDLQSFPPEGLYGAPEVLVIDSGGFETSPAHDLSETYVFDYEPMSWTEDLHSETLDGLPDYPVPDLRDTIGRYEDAAELTSPGACVIGLSINTSSMERGAAERYLQDTRERLGLPTVDAVRTGVAPLVDAIERL